MATSPDNMPQREPTSAMTFGDLVLEVAHEMGVAFYGADGDEEAQVPDNAPDLSECERHVNNGLLKFFNDAPPSGWRFLRPVASVDLWASITTDSAVTGTSVTDSGVTVLTISGASPLSESMEGRMISVTGFTNQVMIVKVLSTSTAEINLNGESDLAGETFAITSTGAYTLPKYFAGMYSGKITYVAGSDVGVSIGWANDGAIRRLRVSSNDNTGNPLWAGVRIMHTDGMGEPLKARRWELVVYPTPSDDQVVEFPFEFHFDKMTDHQESPPVPFSHDETLKAVCLAVVERDVYDKPGRHTDSYREALVKSYEKDARTGPRSLGYFGNPSRGRLSISDWRNNVYDRPEVTGDNFL